MSKRRLVVPLAVMLVLHVGGVAQAWHTLGRVYCDANGDGLIDGSDLPLDGVSVRVANTSGTFSSSALTQNGGQFYIVLPDTPDSFKLNLDPATLPGDAVVLLPAGGEYAFTTTAASYIFQADFLVHSQICLPTETPSGCWMTGGGVKFEPVTREWAAVVGGPKDSVGGNVFPSCSPLPGGGGNWNHVAHSLKLHLKGTDISVVQCGNVDGIPPGTTSPVCSVNFIEFQGSGTVVGVGGSKFPSTPATFFGRVEDRNEPGNEQGANSGALVDRYFLRVVDTSGKLLLLVDADGVDDGKIDPLTITGGNFQIHCSSCEEDTGGSLELLSELEKSAYFLRGDANTDGDVDLSDAVYTLSTLFLTGPPAQCEDAADANDDGYVNVADPIFTISALYAGGRQLPAPFPAADNDPTRDDTFRCGAAE
jgi:hypothetical protein